MTSYLLDTHTFLWWALEPERLPPRVLKELQDPAHRIVLSVVSCWETQIKHGLGKIELDEPLEKIVMRELTQNRWEVLPIHLRHAWRLSDLPPLHHDPFDRLLIAQALTEKLVLVSSDTFISRYPQVKTFWA